MNRRARKGLTRSRHVRWLQRRDEGGEADGEFVGFRIASSEKLDTALREAVVAVDANVLRRDARQRAEAS